jgi:DnaK suppressor protein
MKQEQIQHIKNVLVRKMDELQGASNKMVEEVMKESMELADPLDRAAVELDRTVTLIMRDRDRKLIQNIRETLTRIDEGLFGLCDDCGETLPTKRILAAPLSRLCKSCQEKIEHLEKQKGKGTFLPARGHAYVERNLRPDPDPDPDLSVALGIQNSAERRMANPGLYPHD